MPLRKDILDGTKTTFEIVAVECPTNVFVDAEIEDFIGHHKTKSNNLTKLRIEDDEGETSQEHFHYILTKLSSELSLLQEKSKNSKVFFESLRGLDLDGHYRVNLHEAKLLSTILNQFMTISPTFKRMEFFETHISSDALQYLSSLPIIYKQKQKMNPKMMLCSKLLSTTCSTTTTPKCLEIEFDGCVWVNQQYTDNNNEILKIRISGELNHNNMSMSGLNVLVHNSIGMDVTFAKTLIQTILPELSTKTNLEIQYISFHDLTMLLPSFDYLQSISRSITSDKKMKLEGAPIPIIEFQSCEVHHEHVDNNLDNNVSTETIIGRFSSSDNLCLFEDFNLTLSSQVATAKLLLHKVLLQKQPNSTIQRRTLSLRRCSVSIDLLPQLLSPITDNNKHSAHDVVFDFRYCTFQLMNSTMTVPHIPEIFYDCDYLKTTLPAANAKESLQVVAQFLTNIPHYFINITTFHLCGQNLDGDVLENIADVFNATTNTCKCFKLCCHATNDSMKHLSKALISNKTLTQLNILSSGTSITNAGIEYLVEPLQNHNFTLKDIVFDNDREEAEEREEIHSWNNNAKRKIHFFTTLNWLNRRKILEADLSSSLLSLVMQRVIYYPSIIFWILRAHPHVLFATFRQKRKRQMGTTRRLKYRTSIEKLDDDDEDDDDDYFPTF